MYLQLLLRKYCNEFKSFVFMFLFYAFHISYVILLKTKINKDTFWVNVTDSKTKSEQQAKNRQLTFSNLGYYNICNLCLLQLCCLCFVSIWWVKNISADLYSLFCCFTTVLGQGNDFAQANLLHHTTFCMNLS